MKEEKNKFADLLLTTHQLPSFGTRDYENNIDKRLINTILHFVATCLYFVFGLSNKRYNFVLQSCKILHQIQYVG